MYVNALAILNILINNLQIIKSKIKVFTVDVKLNFTIDVKIFQLYARCKMHKKLKIRIETDNHKIYICLQQL